MRLRILSVIVTLLVGATTLAVGVATLAAAREPADSARSATARTAAVAIPFLRRSYIEAASNDAYRRFAAPGLIQHNPEMKDGLGSGLIGHSQKMTVAARAMAEKKTVGHRS